MKTPKEMVLERLDQGNATLGRLVFDLQITTKQVIDALIVLQKEDRLVRLGSGRNIYSLKRRPPLLPRLPNETEEHYEQRLVAALTPEVP